MTGQSSGKVAWITGGATGIGLASAQALGAAGFKLVISGRRVEELDKAVATLAKSGIAAQARQLDVADATAVQAAADAILGEHGRIDAVVLSAGTNVPNRRWKDITSEAFAKVSAINLNGVAYCVSAVLPAMRKAGSGTIVVVSSWGGWRFLPFTGAAYGATKMGLAPLVESINYEEGHLGIRATLVCPGEVATPILRARPVPPPEEDIARMLKPEDVGSAVAYAVTVPQHVCINELVIAPSWNRIYLGADDLAAKR